MDKADLSKLADKYRKKAEAAFENYQGTGLSRYDRERRNAEDMADAFDMAANAADEHAFCGHLKAELLWHAGQAERALANDASKEDLAELLKAVISTAVTFCHYAKREDLAKEDSSV